MEEGRPIFQQIAEAIERQIIDGTMPEESQAPSINELAAFHRINPATALKGVNLLVADGVLYKRRGVGMFVSSGARERLLAERRNDFQATFVRPVTDQAKRLGIDTAGLEDMIRREMNR